MTVGGLSEVGSEKLRSFDGLSELVRETVPAWSVYLFIDGLGGPWCLFVLWRSNVVSESAENISALLR